MAQQQRPKLAFRIDKLTRSIENVGTGDSLPTVVLPLSEKVSLAIAAYVQAQKAKRDAADARLRKALDRHIDKAMAEPGGIRSLDDIGFAGTGQSCTAEDVRMVSAFIEKQKAKRSASRTTARRKAVARKPKAKARAAHTRA